MSNERRPESGGSNPDEIDWRRRFLDLEPVVCALKYMANALSMLADNELVTGAADTVELTKDCANSLFYMVSRLSGMADAAVATYYDLDKQAGGGKDAPA